MGDEGVFQLRVFPTSGISSLRKITALLLSEILLTMKIIKKNRAFSAQIILKATKNSI